MASQRPKRARKSAGRYTDDAFAEHAGLEEALGIDPDSGAGRGGSGDDFDPDGQSNRAHGLLDQLDSDSEQVEPAARGGSGRAKPANGRLSVEDDGVGSHGSGSEDDKDDRHSRGLIPQITKPGVNISRALPGNYGAETATMYHNKAVFFNEITLPHRRMVGKERCFELPSWSVASEEEDLDFISRLVELQSLVELSEAESAHLVSPRLSRDVLAGPRGQRTVKHMAPGDVVAFDEFFLQPTQGRGAVPRRPAWLLNLGSAVQCAEWAPNQTGRRQFLAVALLASTLPCPFEPSDALDAIIEVWEFKAAPQKDATLAATMDMQSPPSKRLVLCANFGQVLQMKWNHLQTDMRNAVPSLGELAIVTADGHVRVLSVPLPNATELETTFLRPATVAIDITPQNTSFTCLTWLSGTALAAGCANGCVGVWDVGQVISSGGNDPLVWHEVSLTCIVDIEASVPSRPGLVVTSSMDGHVRWTWLAHPGMDCGASPRSRIGSSCIAWHDVSQHLLYVEDLYNLRAIGIRRTWSSTFVATAAGPVQAVASSQLHSALLVGCTDGTAHVMNPIRRTSAKSFNKADYTQAWFTHDWRQGRVRDGQPDFANGLSRLTTGYAIETAEVSGQPGNFNKNRHVPRSQRESRVTHDGVLFATVYENETGVRALGWNPSAAAQGWAAAGMEDGLLVVEDLCYD